MSSIIKVDTIQDQSGNNIINESGNVITIGASGDTITVPAGATVSGFTSAGIDDNATSTAITISSSEDVTFTENILLGDNKKARFGTGNDLEIFHDGSNSNISDVGTGQLVLRTDGAQVIINKGSSENMARFITDGAVELYHNNIKKFETTSAGIDVTGTAVTDGLTVENGTLRLTSSHLAFSGNVSTPNEGAAIFRPAADTIGFSINNSEKVRLTSTGLGIGTTSPSRALTVSGSVSPVIAIVDTGTSGTPSLFFGDSSADNVGKIQYANSTNSLSFVVNSSQRMNIANSGRVGIGVNSPSGLLHVQSASSGASVNSSGDEIIAENSANSGISILSGNSNQGQLIFGDDGDNNVGRLQYNHSDNSMQFIVNASERMRILSDGRVGIGTTNPNRMLTVEGDGGEPDISLVNLDNTNNNFNQIRFLSVGSDDSTRRLGADIKALYTSHSSTNPTTDLLFGTATGSSPSVEKMRLTSLGRLGINDSSPDCMFNIGANSGLANGDRMRIEDGTYKLDIGVGANSFIQTIGAADLKFNTNSSERLRITSDGNVGIGESAPLGKLHVKKSDTSASANAGANALVVEDNSENGISILSGTGTFGNIFFGDSGSNTIGRLVYNHADNSMRFITNNSEHLRITSSGNVGINTTNPETGSLQTISHPGSSQYGLNLDSSETSGTQYHLQFKRNGTAAGYITSNSATTIAVNNASDERLKENIQNSNSAIQDIKDLKVRQFDWKDNIDTHKDFGFIAQELVNVIPEAVTQGTDELDENSKPVRTWGVDYSHIVPRLVKVCQEQQTKIEELEARITTLEANNP